MSSLVRLFVALLWVSTVSLVSAPAVEAATVSLIIESSPPSPGGTLTYQAAPGEGNQVVVTMTGANLDAWIVSERGLDASGPIALTAGPGCTSLDSQTALCEYDLDVPTEVPFHVEIVLDDSLTTDFGVWHDFAWASGACGPYLYLLCQTRISGGEGDDTVFANDVGQSEFGGDVSTVNGGPGDDMLYAGRRGSRLIGGPGADTLFGSAGRDIIGGGDGEDTISGGLRADELRGGAGRDTFYARDGYRDRVFGGLGRDRARVDRLLDRVRSIERFF
jgi:Ca2+-binding RTX toxin-like protein